MRRRDFLGLFGGATASVFIPARTLFLPPWRRRRSIITDWQDVEISGFQPIPFREPDPALFEMLEDMRKAAEDLCTVSETWWRGGDGRFYVQSRFYNADQPVRVLATYQWPRLELPFV